MFSLPRGPFSQYGCGSKPMVSFWGGCTTHFSTYFSGDWDVHWGYDLDFDPWPYTSIFFGGSCPTGQESRLGFLGLLLAPFRLLLFSQEKRAYEKHKEKPGPRSEPSKASGGPRVGFFLLSVVRSFTAQKKMGENCPLPSVFFFFSSRGLVVWVVYLLYPVVPWLVGGKRLGLKV